MYNEKEASMAVKVEVKEDKIYGGKVIYTDNCVTDKLVETVNEILATEDKVRVSFGVTGETLHTILSHQLKEKLSESCDVEIGRYKCHIRKAVANV